MRNTGDARVSGRGTIGFQTGGCAVPEPMILASWAALDKPIRNDAGKRQEMTKNGRRLNDSWRLGLLSGRRAGPGVRCGAISRDASVGLRHDYVISPLILDSYVDQEHRSVIHQDLRYPGWNRPQISLTRVAQRGRYARGFTSFASKIYQMRCWNERNIYYWTVSPVDWSAPICPGPRLPREQFLTWSPYRGLRQ